MRPIRIAGLLIATLAVPTAASAQATPILNVRQLMTPAEFQASGLGKLSTAELTILNLWLESFATRVIQASQQSTAPSDTPDVVESRIEGEFECWDGESVFRLTNGQIWEQAAYAYKYCYKYRPEVTIVRSGRGHRMIVDGVEGSVQVRRIR